MSNDLSFSVGVDPTDFNRGLANAADNATRYSSEIVKKSGEKLFGLKDVSNVVATALGLNLHEIADKVARFFTGMSEEEEAAYKNSEKLNDQLLEASRKNMLARMTDEQRYQLALQERDKLLEKINNFEVKNGRDQERLAQMRLDLEEKVAQTQEYEIKQREKAAQLAEKQLEASFRAHAAEYKASLDQLSTVEKIANLKDTILAGQVVLRDASISEKNAELIKASIAEKQVMLLEQQNKLHEQQQKLAEEHATAAGKLAQLKFQALPVDQQLVELEKQRKDITASIAEKKKAGEDTVYAEVTLLENAAQLEKLRKENADEVLGVQEAITDELEDQVEATQTRVAIERVGNDYASQSTIALQGTLARLKSRWDPNGDRPNAGDGGVTTGMFYGAYLNNAAIRPEIRAIEAELARRREVGDYARYNGADEARYRYGDAATDAALRDLSDDNKRTRTATEQISTDLRRIFNLQ